MPAKVETMMYVREKPWHGLGTEVPEAPTSADALRFAGLDWTVRQEPVYNWKSVSQERLDSKTLKAEHPALYKKYANKTSYRRFTIKAAV